MQSHSIAFAVVVDRSWSGGGKFSIGGNIRFFTIGTCFFEATILIEVSTTGLEIDDERKSVP